MALGRCLSIMSRDVTSIEIKKSTWKELNQQKEPGDSFDDVIQRLLHAREEPEEEPDGGVEVQPEGQLEEKEPIHDCPDCPFYTDEWDEWDEHRENCPGRE